MKKFLTLLAVIFAEPVPAAVAYQQRQQEAHAAYDAWYKAKEEKAEVARLESWFTENNRVSGIQKDIDARNARTRAIYAWVAGEWKCVGRKDKSCIVCPICKY